MSNKNKPASSAKRPTIRPSSEDPPTLDRRRPSTQASGDHGGKRSDTKRKSKPLLSQSDDNETNDPDSESDDDGNASDDSSEGEHQASGDDGNQDESEGGINSKEGNDNDNLDGSKDTHLLSRAKMDQSKKKATSKESSRQRKSAPQPSTYDGFMDLDEDGSHRMNSDDQHVNQHTKPDQDEDAKKQKIKDLALSTRKMRRAARYFARTESLEAVAKELAYLQEKLLGLAETENERELTEDETREKKCDTYFLQRMKMRLKDDELSSEEPSDAEPMAEEPSDIPQGGLASDPHTLTGQQHGRATFANPILRRENISSAKDQNSEDHWEIQKILRENRTQYEVRWADSWVSKESVTPAAKQEWNLHKRNEAREKKKQKKEAQKSAEADGDATD